GPEALICNEAGRTSSRRDRGHQPADNFDLPLKLIRMRRVARRSVPITACYKQCGEPWTLLIAPTGILLENVRHLRCVNRLRSRSPQTNLYFLLKQSSSDLQ